MHSYFLIAQCLNVYKKLDVEITTCKMQQVSCNSKGTLDIHDVGIISYLLVTYLFTVVIATLIICVEASVILS